MGFVWLKIPPKRAVNLFSVRLGAIRLHKLSVNLVSARIKINLSKTLYAGVISISSSGITRNCLLKVILQMHNSKLIFLLMFIPT